MATKLQIFRFKKDGCDWDISAYSDNYDITTHLGGKGAGLVKMCGMGLNVPPGFTISTAVCKEYMKMKSGPQDVLVPKEMDALLTDLMLDVEVQYNWLSEQFGYFPLVSVRSGAPISMPGMMDTILNVGLTDQTLEEWSKRIGDKPALDSYRRLIQMLGSTAFGIDSDKFEFQLLSVKKQAQVEHDSQLSKKNLNELLLRYKSVFKENVGMEFPQHVMDQIGFAVKAVFDSWMNERAIEYRKINKIDENMGTACTVQSMVFGNMGEDSGSGVLFTRNPSTGEDLIMGEYLTNAQGEDVVAGIRTPEKLDLNGSKGEVVGWKADLADLCVDLEKQYRDMVDVEFTVQKGELFILQSRTGKRSAAAAFRIAVDLVAAGVITKDEALKRLTVEQFKIMQRKVVDPKFKTNPTVMGLPACPGVATGKPVFSSQDAINCTEPCILVTYETTPEDIAGMNKAMGILTKTGGATSHAAVVARAMDKPCIVGATDLNIPALQEVVAEKNDAGPNTITIDGSTGKVWIGIDVPVVDNAENPALKQVMQWCQEKAGGVPQYVVDLAPDVDLGTPYVITTLPWWGDDTILEVVLESIAKKTKRDHITLDIRLPKTFRPTEDALLDHAFMDIDADEAGFELELMNSLLDMAKQGVLSGLNVRGFAGTDQMRKTLTSAGVNLMGEPKVLADVLNGNWDAAKSFIDSVIGGEEAWEQLKKIMTTAGVVPKLAATAVPEDYAVFTTLRKAQ